MGDGRYYTFYQFFDVLFSMFLAGYSIFSLINCYYKKNTEFNIKFSYLTFLFITLFSCLRVTEVVIPNLELSILLRNSQTAIILFLLNILAVNLYKEAKKIKKIFIVCFSILLVLSSFLKIFTKDYIFHLLIYSLIYKIILSISVLFLFIKILKIIKNYRFKYNKKQIYYLYWITFIIILGVYCSAVISQNSFVDYIEIILMLFMTNIINLIFSNNNESSYSILAFDNIGDMGFSYIFVIDLNGKIIYKNNAAKTSKFFKMEEVISVKDISSIFNGEKTKKLKHHDKEYLMTKIDNTRYYFNYKIRALYKSNTELGSIVSFTDISELIKMLNILEDKKRQSKEINKKLNKYSKVVYSIEKEKEINKLLEKIVFSREEQMEELAKIINNAKDKIDDKLFEEYIDKAIYKSNQILEDVRETVSKNREYYGG